MFLEEPPRVGKKYKVPFVYSTIKETTLKTPILNKFYIDYDIPSSSLQPHAHIDIRFCTEELIKFHTNDSFGSNLVVFCSNNILDRINDFVESCEFECINDQNFVELQGKSSSLENKYAEIKMKCLKCPHQGTDLSSFVPNDEGNYICPAHGLQWNQKSGKLVPKKIIQEKIIRNYLKYNNTPSRVNISTFTNNVKNYLTPGIKLSNFDINNTLEVDINLTLDPFLFNHEYVEFKYDSKVDLFGVVYWKNNQTFCVYNFNNSVSVNSLSFRANYNES